MAENREDLEAKREYAWKLYLYYCEKLAELREKELKDIVRFIAECK